ncbi:MAG: hypothetical protein ABII82_00135 [Verrucomicrobiota bacterium]
MLLSESLGVTANKLRRLGVFDSYLGIDSLLHVDPARLRSTRVPELKNSYKNFHRYFEGVLEMVAAAKPGNALERQAIGKLIFPEVSQAALGYSKTTNSGRGVSKDVATRLYNTAKDITDAGIKNPAIFELAVLFEDKFGPDLISDMTIFIILDDLSAYNKRVAKTLGVKTCERLVHGKKATFVKAKHGSSEILLIPVSLLAQLPLAQCVQDIDMVTAYGESLRNRLNKEIGKIWKKHSGTFTKSQVKGALLGNPKLLKDFLKAYIKADAQPYDLEKDPLGIVTWHRASRESARANPKPLTPPKDTAGVRDVVRSICEQFKFLIEEKGLQDLLFNESDAPKREGASQLLFFGVADAYCAASNLDISREPQTGRGPADFKVSKGYHERVIVELKLSSNGKYLDGLTEQLPTYLHAEKAAFGFLVLIKVGHHDLRLKKLGKLHSALTAEGKKLPELVVIDALKKPTASKLKRGKQMGFFDEDQL